MAYAESNSRVNQQGSGNAYVNSPTTVAVIVAGVVAVVGLIVYAITRKKKGKA